MTLIQHLLATFCVASTLITPQAAFGFGGEDPVTGNPWYHEVITRNAAISDGVKFSSNPRIDAEPAPTGLLDSFKTDPRRKDDMAAETIAWHADYVDSYLYNPLWWAQNGIDRFKASRATAPELEKVHFDDLFDADKTRYMFRRYASGTMTGLLWAMENDDVAAAQNIVGVSLHAFQDFYSHSSWIDDKNRRKKTFFQFSPVERAKMPLYTGAYEHDVSHGVKHHGKFLYACSAMNQPGVKEIMSVACGPASPMGNDPICRSYDACQSGTSVQFEVKGVKIPKNVIYQAPTGIAVDNTWLAEIGVKERGLTDITGEQAFNTAKGLATEASRQWLLILEANMKALGPKTTEFWSKVKSDNTDQEIREQQFENYTKFPYMFLSAGPYPPPNLTKEEYYLRVRLKTAKESKAKTNSDIHFRADGVETNPPTIFDYMPRANPILAYNDFEAGDDAVYIAGPYEKLPKTVELYNNSADGKEVLTELGKKLLDAALAPIKGIAATFNKIIGKDADWIGVEHLVWMPDELKAIPDTKQSPAKTTKLPGLPALTIPAGKQFSIPVNGGDKGHYKVYGYIVKTAESPNDYEFEVRLTSLECIKESKWDRGSDSDEPFVMALLIPLPGESQPFLSQPFEDVDAGETRALNQVFTSVKIPKEYGMLNIAINVMESDDENQKKRQELLETFHTGVDKSTEDETRGLLAAVGAAVDADWKLQDIEIYAWTRGDTIRGGTVLKVQHNGWIKGKDKATFKLEPAGLRNFKVRTDDLLFFPENGISSEPTKEIQDEIDNPQSPLNPDYSPEKAPPTIGSVVTGSSSTGGGGGTVTSSSTGGNINGGNSNGGNPATGTNTTGTNTTGGNNATGTFGGEFKQLEVLSVRLDSARIGENNTLEAIVTFKHGRPNLFGFQNGSVGVWVTDADGIGYRGAGNVYEPLGVLPEIVKRALGIEKQGELKLRYLFPLPKGAVPLKTITFRENGSELQNFDISSVQIPNAVPAGITISSLVGGSGGFAELGEYDVRLDGVKRGRMNTLQAFLTLKNVGSKMQQFTSGDFNISIVDENGASLRNNGNLYRASGGPEPIGISNTIMVNPESEAKIRVIFPLPKTVAPKRLIISTYGDASQTFELPQIP